MSTKKKPWRRNYKRELAAVNQPGSLHPVVRDTDELAFRRGYLLATANIMRTHDQDVIAEDVLRAYDSTGEINWQGIDPMERKILKPIAAEIVRKRSVPNESSSPTPR